jgi:hypothetical protein
MMKTINTIVILGTALTLSGCSIFGGKDAPQYQQLPPVKVITETVEVEIYQPPMPREISLNDIEWKVITTTPCKPATGTKILPGGRSYNTTERFAYEDVTNEDGTTSRQVVRDAEGNRVELEQLTDSNGEVIQVCGNLQQKIAEIETMLDGNFVIMAITPSGYEKMAANLQEIKRYINQQKEIIFYYREATKPKGKDGWLEENTERQENQIEAEQENNQEQYTPQQPPTVEPAETGFSLKKFINI